MIKLVVDVGHSEILDYWPSGQVKSTRYYPVETEMYIGAIKRVGHGGGCCYQGRDIKGNWHNLYKNKNLKAKLPVLGYKEEISI